MVNCISQVGRNIDFQWCSMTVKELNVTDCYFYQIQKLTEKVTKLL